MSKYLFVLLGLSGTAGATAAAISFSRSGEKVETSNRVSSENEARREEEPRFETIAPKQQERQELQLESEKKLGFEGKLVFNRKTVGSGRGSALTPTYKGEIFSNQDYEKKKKEWETSDEEGDNEAHITIDLSPKKTKKTEQELKEYLNKLNKKILENSGTGQIDKLQKSLENDESEFKENFGKDAYDQLLKRIGELKGTKKN